MSELGDFSLTQLEAEVARRREILDSEWPKKSEFLMRMDDEDELELFLHNECGLSTSSDIAEKIKEKMWGNNISTIVTVEKSGEFSVTCKNEAHQ